MIVLIIEPSFKGRLQLIRTWSVCSDKSESTAAIKFLLSLNLRSVGLAYEPVLYKKEN